MYTLEFKSIEHLKKAALSISELVKKIRQEKVDKLEKAGFPIKLLTDYTSPIIVDMSYLTKEQKDILFDVSSEKTENELLLDELIQKLEIKEL